MIVCIFLYRFYWNNLKVWNKIIVVLYWKLDVWFILNSILNKSYFVFKMVINNFVYKLWIDMFNFIL